MENNKTTYISDEEVREAQRDILENLGEKLNYQEAFEACIDAHVEEEYWSKLEDKD